MPGNAEPSDQAVGVLHGHDRGVLDGLLDLLEGGGRDADAGDQAVLAHLDHRGEQVLERGLPGHGLLLQAQVHRGQLLGAELAEVGLDVLAQLLGRQRRQPAALGVAARPDLRDDGEVGGVGVQGLTDEGVGHVGAVELGRVDVVHAELDRAPQDGDRRVVVLRRPHHPGAGELHGTEADAVDLVAGEVVRAGECCGGRRHDRHATRGPTRPTGLARPTSPASLQVRVTDLSRVGAGPPGGL
jgi:hypothetical protein